VLRGDPPARVAPERTSADNVGAHGNTQGEQAVSALPSVLDTEVDVEVLETRVDVDIATPVETARACIEWNPQSHPSTEAVDELPASTGDQCQQTIQTVSHSPPPRAERSASTPAPVSRSDSAASPVATPSAKDPYLLSRWPAYIKRRSYGYRVPSPMNRQPGQCIVYWATTSPRCCDNPALALCRWLSHSTKLPIVAFCVFADGVCPGPESRFHVGEVFCAQCAICCAHRPESECIPVTITTVG
jgi:hypothetical protein